MDRRTLPVVAMLLSLLSAAPAEKPRKVTNPAAVDGEMAVFFSPGGGALDGLVEQIAQAKKTLDVQAYLLTTKEILKPIVDAHGRGVKVRVIMDSDNAGSQYSGATFLANAGVPVWTDAQHKEAHNKVMLIDGFVLITGSFNFTLAADKQNAENLLIIQGRAKLYAAYQKNFEDHLQHATKYEAKK